MARAETRLKLFKQVIVFKMNMELSCNCFFPEPLIGMEDWKWACSWRELLDPEWVFSVEV